MKRWEAYEVMVFFILVVFPIIAIVCGTLIRIFG